MEHFIDKQYLCSNRFDINILKKSMINDLDKLSEFSINPIPKDDIDFIIIELYKGVQIFELWLSCLYNDLDENKKQELREQYLERNRSFLKESRPKDIEKFYDNLYENYKQVRSEVKEKLNAAC